MTGPFVFDLRSLALFRIGLGLTILLDLALRAADFRFFLTDAGPLPLQALVKDTLTGATGFSLYFLSGFALWPYLLFLATAALAAALMVGWRVDRVAPALWLLCLSLQTRAPLALNSSDRLILSFLFFGCFLPWDRVWAVGRPALAPGEGTTVRHPAATALLLQMALMYAMAFSYKLGTVWTGDGSALFRTLLSAQYARNQALLAYPDLCRWGSYAAVAWEGLGAFLLLLPWPRLRLAALAVFALFHLGTGLLLDIGLFPLVCGLGLLACLPSEAFPGPVPSGATPLPCSTWQRVLIVGALVLIGTGNLGQRFVAKYEDSALRKICSLTGFEQRWALFAPPRAYDVWYVAVATYKDGSQRDLYRPTREPAQFHQKPAGLRDLSHRRRQYGIAMEHVARHGLRDWMVYDLYRAESARVGGADNLLRVELYQDRSENRVDFADAPVHSTLFAVWPRLPSEGESAEK